MKAIRVPIRPMTADAFAPYGALARADERPADRRVMAPMRFRCDGETTVTSIWQPAGAMSFSRLERHHAVTQTFFQLSGGPSVVCVAPPSPASDPDRPPAPGEVVGFIIDPGQGYSFHIGTWHSLDRLVLTPPGATFIILNVEPNPTDIIDYATSELAVHQNLDGTPEPVVSPIDLPGAPLVFELDLQGS